MPSSRTWALPQPPRIFKVSRNVLPGRTELSTSCRSCPGIPCQVASRQSQLPRLRTNLHYHYALQLQILPCQILQYFSLYKHTISLIALCILPRREALSLFCDCSGGYGRPTAERMNQVLKFEVGSIFGTSVNGFTWFRCFRYLD